MFSKIINDFKNKNLYITNNIIYEHLFIISNPLIILFLTSILTIINFNQFQFEYKNTYIPYMYLFLGTIIHAHLFVTVFRSHLNQKVFKLYKIRFVLIPILLFIFSFYSLKFLVFLTVLAVWWDVYHSGLQTFGFGRIYEERIGNDTNKGRMVDYWFNVLFYLGPILAGYTLFEHINFFKDFSSENTFNSLFFNRIPFLATEHTFFLTIIFLIILISYTIFYVFYNIKLYKSGFKISFLKLYLYVTTSIVSIICWGFNTFGEAFFIMNVFHAVQYFGIIWAVEKKHIINNIFKFKTIDFFSKTISLSIILFITFLYGFLVSSNILQIEFSNDENIVRTIMSISIIVSLLHFWYDGFIWSVKRKDV